MLPRLVPLARHSRAHDGGRYPCLSFACDALYRESFNRSLSSDFETQHRTSQRSSSIDLDQTSKRKECLFLPRCCIQSHLLHCTAHVVLCHIDLFESVHDFLCCWQFQSQSFTGLPINHNTEHHRTRTTSIVTSLERKAFVVHHAADSPRVPRTRLRAHGKVRRRCFCLLNGVLYCGPSQVAFFQYKYAISSKRYSSSRKQLVTKSSKASCYTRLICTHNARQDPSHQKLLELWPMILVVADARKASTLLINTFTPIRAA